ncbi:Phytosulfokine receptor 1 [Morus notabilis]|uniref:Phytosulfokine receptor 1 n=1 Tax=Morus notabilis TaxID=981085 RepID=W9SNY8_9ROSA|nr:ankyrin repeat-containing protein BDA1 [Morus notabilis]EXC37939.1 Phytosulfokine receptor 1 [Morus notabilis]
MDARLEVAAKAGDIEALYSLLKEDSYLLERIDAVPFIDTPLHIAASAGHVYFALEIMRLKPSYAATKLNQDGFSPIHLALQNGKSQMVLRLVEMNRGLVQVQGREGKTRLHFSVEYDMVDVLAKFLSVCPKAIQILTIRKETALHIAVKNDNLEAVKLLLGWLDHVDKDVVLKLADDEGNTVLHMATSKNQIEMVRLFINGADVNAKNLVGLTALDVLENQKQLANEKLQRMLLRGGALKGSSLPSIPTNKDAMKTKMSWHEKFLISDFRKKLYMSNDERNTMLVVAVLFATANYQAILNNPYMYEDLSFMLFSFVNHVAFLASMFEIYLYLPKGRMVLQLVVLMVVCFALLMSTWKFLMIEMAFLILVYYPKLLVHYLKWLSKSKQLQLLDLPWNNLVGTIPARLGHFDSLFYLDISNNSLNGAIPESITGLKGLIDRDISLEEPFPDFPFFMQRNVTIRGLQYNRNLVLIRNLKKLLWT